MNNQESLRFFENLSQQPVTMEITKFNPSNDHSQLDSDFIRQYITNQSDVLDLGSGAGVMLNKYYSYTHSVVAVEKYESFAQLIVRDPKVHVVVSDLFDFETTQSFDVIVMFGTAHYFNTEEISRIYKKYMSYIKPKGKFIIKNQFGVKETVEVNGFSQELKCNYYAQYRYLQTEIDLLKSAGLNQVEVFDIYPPSFNRWDNTHFYALVASVES